MITTINPSTGQAIQTYKEMLDSQVAEIIQSCNSAFLHWKNQSFATRKEKLLKVAQTLLHNKIKYATLIHEEMGKPIPAATAEIEKCAWACQFYAEEAENFLKPRKINTDMKESYISYHPKGVLFAIMPWNYPFWQVFRFAAPNLMAGNAIVLKHAPNVTGCGLIIEQLFTEAGYPANLFRTLIIDETQAKAVIANPLVHGVTLTGSQRAGRAVAAEAGTHLKKVVLELGGNDPYVILEDADLEQAAEICMQSRLANSGQVCIAAKRLIAVAPIKEQFKEIILQKLKNFPLANQAKDGLGPLAREDLRNNLHEQVQKSVALGARLLAGGELPQEPGFFYPVTVLDQVKKGMPAYEEEVFGPVISFVDARDQQEAIAIANDTYYGLSAAVFTRNLKLGQDIADNQITAGACYVNKMVSSDPRLPFGGTKGSGFGRELGEAGILEFVNIKSIGINN